MSKCSYRRQVDKLKDVWLSCELRDGHDGLHQIDGLEWYTVERKQPQRICAICAQPWDIGHDTLCRTDAVTWTPEVEHIRTEMLRRFSDKLSMEEIASCAYALAGEREPESQ